jgi:Zn finger protein HypA/HybF involved in hydrogenase expression
MNESISFRLINPYRESRCKHAHVVIDEELWKLECADCGASLDPIAYLVKIAKEEAVAEYRLNELNKMVAEAQVKLRTKCIHCGQFTTIQTKAHL